MAEAFQVNIQPNIVGGITTFQNWANKNKLKIAVDDSTFIRPLGKMRREANLFEASLQASNSRVLAFGASVLVLNSVASAMRDLAKSTIEVEKSLIDINRILNLSERSLTKFGNNLFKIAEETANSFNSVADAALEFSRQGLSLNDVLSRTSETLKLVRLTGLDAKKAVELLTATVNAFNNIEIGEAVNKFVAVESQFAVSARDLVEGLSRVGSSAVDAKVDLDELNGLITALQQTTARGGPVIGNALKTIFLRLQRTDTLQALSDFNIAVKDVQGNTLPAVMILQDFAKTYKTLTDSSKAYLREQVAGVYQGNILSAILKELSQDQNNYTKALEKSKKASNEADQANEKLNRSLSALLSQTASELENFSQNVGSQTFEPIAKSLLSGLKGILKGTNTLLSEEGDPMGSFLAKGLLKGFKNILSGPGLIGALAVIGQAGKNMFKFVIEAIPSLLHISTIRDKQRQTEEYILQLTKDEDFYNELILNSKKSEREIGLDILKRAQRLTDQERERLQFAQKYSQIISKTLGSPHITPEGLYTPGGLMKKDPLRTSKTSAQGYLPPIQKEAQSIKNGVGGAPKSSYPVVIKDFPFGMGKKGTMVANSSEFIVPNYDNKGGAAIFNQQMIKMMGKPSGSIPIAAEGYRGGDPKVRAEQAINEVLNPSSSLSNAKKKFERAIAALEKEGKGIKRLTKQFESAIQKRQELKKTPATEPPTAAEPQVAAEAKVQIKEEKPKNVEKEDPIQKAKEAEIEKIRARMMSDFAMQNNPSSKEKEPVIKETLQSKEDREREIQEIERQMEEDYESFDNEEPPTTTETKAFSQPKKTPSKKIATKVAEIQRALKKGEITLSEAYAKFNNEIKKAEDVFGAEEILPTETKGEAMFRTGFIKSLNKKADDLFAEVQSGKMSEKEAQEKLQKSSEYRSLKRLDEQKSKEISSLIPQRIKEEEAAKKEKAKKEEKSKLISSLEGTINEPSLISKIESGEKTAAEVKGILKQSGFSELLTEKQQGEYLRKIESAEKKFTGKTPNTKASDAKRQKDELKARLVADAESAIELMRLSKSIDQTLVQDFEDKINELKKIRGPVSDLTKRFESAKKQTKTNLLQSQEKDIQKFLGKETSPGVAFKVQQGQMEFQLAQKELKGMPGFSELTPAKQTSYLRNLETAESKRVESEEKAKKKEIADLEGEAKSFIESMKKSAGVSDSLTQRFNDAKDKLKALGVQTDKLETSFKTATQKAKDNFQTEDKLKKQEAARLEIQNKLTDLSQGKIKPEDAISFIEKEAEKKILPSTEYASFTKPIKTQLADEIRQKIFTKDAEKGIFQDSEFSKQLKDDAKKLATTYKLSQTVQDNLIREINLFAQSIREQRNQFDYDFRTALNANISAYEKNEKSLKDARREVYKLIFSQKLLDKETKRQYLQMVNDRFVSSQQAVAVADRQTNNFSTGASVALSLLAPMVAGFIQQGITGDRERFELSRGERIAERGVGLGLTYGGMGAAVGGSMGGTPGATIGAAIGGLGGFIAAIVTATKSLDELRQSIDENENKTKENVKAVEERIEIMKEYSSLENKTALDNLQFANKLSRNLLSIGDKNLRAEIGKNGINESELKKAVERYQKDRATSLFIQQLGTMGRLYKREDTELKEEDVKVPDDWGSGSETMKLKRQVEVFGPKSKEAVANVLGPFASFFEEIDEKEIKMLEQAAEKGISEFSKVFSDLPLLIGKEKKKELEASLQEGFGKNMQGFSDIFGNLAENLKLIEKEETDAGAEIRELGDSFRAISKSTKEMTRSMMLNIDLMNRTNKMNQFLYEVIDDSLSGIQGAGALKAEFNYQRQISQLKFEETTQKQTFTSSNIGKIQEQMGKTLQESKVVLDFSRSFKDSFFEDPKAALDDLENFLKSNKDSIVKPEEVEKLKDVIFEAKRNYINQTENFSIERQIIEQRKKIDITKSELLEKERQNNLEFQRNTLQREITFTKEKSDLQYQLSANQYMMSQYSSSPYLTTRQKGAEKINILKKNYIIESQLSQKEFTLKREQLVDQQKLEIQKLDSQKDLISSNFSLVESLNELNKQIEKNNEKSRIESSKEIDMQKSTIFDYDAVKREAELYEKNKNSIIRPEQFLKEEKSPSNDFGIKYVDQQKRIDDAYAIIEKKYAETSSEAKKISDDYEKRINELKKSQEEIDNLEIEKLEAERDAALKSLNQKTIQDLEDAKREASKKTFGQGLRSGFAQIRQDVDDFEYTMGSRIPISFRDNMAQALNEIGDKAKSIEEALRDAAISFLTEIRNAFNQRAVGNIMLGFETGFGAVKDKFATEKQRGGIIKAQNGMYISGSRTGDKNPALLEDGEYVLNRNAVRAMGGPAALDRLNFAMAPRFANGGYANLNEPIDSNRFSGFFYQSQNPELQEKRAEFEAEYRARLQKEAEKKAKSKQLKQLIASVAVSTAMSVGSSYAKDYVSGLRAYKGPLSPTYEYNSDPIKTDFGTKFIDRSLNNKQKGGSISMGFANKDSVPVFAAGGEYMLNSKAVRKYGVPYLSRLNGGEIPAYQAGGAVSDANLGSQATQNYKTEININMNGSSSANVSSDSSTDVEKQKELSKRIESAVRKIIQEEQRPTGLLSRRGRKL